MKNKEDQTKKLDYAEHAVGQLMDFHLQDMEILREEVRQTFAFTFGATATLFGYLLAVMHPEAALEFQNWQLLTPLIATIIFLAWLGVHLVHRGMMAGPVLPKGNNASALLTGPAAGYTSAQIRQAEALNYDARIEAIRVRNVAVGAALNLVRRRILWAPGVFAVTYLLVYFRFGWPALRSLLA